MLIKKKKKGGEDEEEGIQKFLIFFLMNDL